MKIGNCLWLIFLCATLAVGGCTSKRPSVEASPAPDMDNPVSLEAVKAYEAGNGQKSLELYQELVAANPSDHVSLNNMGVILLRSGQSKAALDAFESASLLAPQNSDYLINAGFALIKEQEYDEALTFFDRAIQLAPRNAASYYGKGVAFFYMNEPEIALGLFRQSVALDPTNGESLFMKAYTEQKNGLWLDAVKDYTAYMFFSENKIQKANAYSNRALCYFQLQDFKKGMTDLDEAMKLNDSSSIYYYNRAQGYQMRQDYENAVSDYTRAISRKASFPEAYINRGELNYLLEKEAKGCADLKRACDLGYCEPYEKYESAGKCEN